jgi:hypothetical protein
MVSNVEVKAAVLDLGPIRARAAALASAPAQIVEQTDTFFVVPRNRLKIREFPDGSGELISYARDDRQGPTESVYFRTATGDTAGAIGALRRALEFAPDYAPAIFSLKTVEYQQGNRAEGRRLFHSLLSYPVDTDVSLLSENREPTRPNLGRRPTGRILGSPVGQVEDTVTAKETVRALLDRLQDDCSLDDVLYHLYVVQAVALGAADADAGRVLSHEQVALELRRKWQLGSVQ